MLRVGLTGGLGSGKSTVARHFRSLGAEIIEADELGRALMEPGQHVYDEIVREFGEEVVVPPGDRSDGLAGKLDRAKLADLAFRGGRLHELNAIVHPAVIAAQGDWMRQVFAKNPKAVAIIESALIFEVERDARLRGESEGVLISWRRRFDRVVAVTAPKELRIARYVTRVAPAMSVRSREGWEEKLAADARARIANQLSDEEKAARADFVIENSGDLASLKAQADAVWRHLSELSNYSTAAEF